MSDLFEGAPAGPGTFERDGVRVDVADVDRLAARIREIFVPREETLDAAIDAARRDPPPGLPPVELLERDSGLDGAVLRGRDGEGVAEAVVASDGTRWRRWEVENGERNDVDWVVPRPILGRWLDRVARPR